MTTKTPERVTITVLATGLTLPGPSNPNAYFATSGRTALRGEVVEVERSETVNRNGDSWLDLTEEQQEARWGKQMFVLGDHSEGIELGDDDEYGARYYQWLKATEEARKISDPAERSAALREIKAKYPEQNRSSQTSTEY
ncbi:hypothetical protein [Microbacterium istanbulense]|uniref:Uncharacterized protein n=1 Tax=Microbacterium istanbulense TaxID=3122049 RepID=A0ABU8LKU3_9MICO